MVKDFRNCMFRLGWQRGGKFPVRLPNGTLVISFVAFALNISILFLLLSDCIFTLLIGSY